MNEEDRLRKVNVLASVTSGSLVQLLAILLLPTLGLSLYSPMILGAVPVIGAKFMSPTEIYWSSSFHYNSTIVVIVLMATIDGLHRRGTQKWSRLRQKAWLASAVAVAIAFGNSGPAVALVRNSSDITRNYAKVTRALAQIPDGAKVAVSDTVAPYLVDRTSVFGIHDGFTDSSGSKLQVAYLAIDQELSSPALTSWVDRGLKSGKLRTIAHAQVFRKSGQLRCDLLILRVSNR